MRARRRQRRRADPLRVGRPHARRTRRAARSVKTMAFDAATLERHGLKPDEYARIVALLGRDPNLTELGLFSVMWSEHCSYKSSRVHLRTLPTEGLAVLQ